MIQLMEFKKKQRIPECDYILEKTDKLDELIGMLTPKFEGKWHIVLVEPAIKFCLDFLNKESTLPEWIDMTMMLSRKRLEVVVLKYPKLQPKEKSFKETVDELLASMKHLIEPSAKRALLSAVGSNSQELQEALTKLDEQCEGATITVKDVHGVVNKQRRVYASQVLQAFLLLDPNRWNLYRTLIHDIGMDISYYAMYKQAKLLLEDKSKFLQNEDVKNYAVNKIDATRICYCYILFSYTKSPQQLLYVLQSLEDRDKKYIEFLQQYKQ